MGLKRRSRLVYGLVQIGCGLTERGASFWRVFPSKAPPKAGIVCAHPSGFKKILRETISVGLG